MSACCCLLAVLDGAWCSLVQSLVQSRAAAAANNRPHRRCVAVHHLLQYKAQEDTFDKLLLTPDLDKRLAARDSDLQQAAHAVESAVAAAIQLAYHSAPGSSSSDAAGSGSDSSSGESFGCIALSSDDQCVVDWDSESMWDNAAASQDSLLDEEQEGGSSSSGSDSSRALDARAGGADSADGMARAAAALNGATGEVSEVASAHTFLQRLLYKINRLNHFW